MFPAINAVKEIPPEETKLYVAMRCKCHSWITFYPGDVGAPKKCFLCKRQWVMDAEGDVSLHGEKKEN